MLNGKYVRVCVVYGEVLQLEYLTQSDYSL